MNRRCCRLVSDQLWMASSRPADVLRQMIDMLIDEPDDPLREFGDLLAPRGILTHISGNLRAHRCETATSEERGHFNTYLQRHLIPGLSGGALKR